MKRWDLHQSFVFVDEVVYKLALSIVSGKMQNCYAVAVLLTDVAPKLDASIHKPIVNLLLLDGELTQDGAHLLALKVESVRNIGQVFESVEGWYVLFGRDLDQNSVESVGLVILERD